jgi:type I restriction enzyme M protein
MQDDCYLIAADGWKAETRQIQEEVKSGKNKGEMKDKGWTCDLIPKPFIVARYFPEEQAAIDALQAELDDISASLEELKEEHGGEEGAFSELDKINKGEIGKRLKEIKHDADYAEEAKVLKAWVKLEQRQSVLKGKVTEADTALDTLVYDKYPQLGMDEIKTLVVDDKWLTTLALAVQGELDRVSQTLTSRIRQLAERYAMPLPELVEEVTALSARVDAHLERMGFEP